MSFFRQVWAMTAMNLAAIPQRPGAALVTMIGVASVVAVLISLLAVGAGVNRSVNLDDQPERAVVLSGSAPVEYMGNFTPAQVAMIAEAPGVRRDPQGRPMVQPLAAVIVEVANKTDGATANLLFRGTGDIGREMNKSTLHIVQGRIFKPGLHELIVGRAVQKRFRNMDVGDVIALRGVPWNVVGLYEDQGALDENSIVADADTVLAAFQRTGYQSVGVMLQSPKELRRFKDALTSNPQLNVTVKSLSQYYHDQTKGLTSLFDFVGYFVGGVMAVGAVFGAITTMYSAVDGRVREIATVRALGFGGAAVVTSVMIESLLLAIPGALVGIGLAWLLFNNHDMSTGGVSFAMTITPGLVVLGVIWAVVIGFIGGFAPAIRAARLPVATALRAT
ncbi:MAG: ABC transporter permease [Caulobacterales bacterium]